jgi:uncharacterized membrane protein
MGFASFIPFIKSINRRRRPNMRMAFDYESRKGIQSITHKKTKKLTAREIARIRFMLQQDKKAKQKRQWLMLAVSLVLLAVFVGLFLLIFNWFAAQPADIYHSNP